MTIDPLDFRRVLGRFTTGVTVITTRDSSRAPVGLTANAFTSVSLVPPLVLVCVDRTSDTHDLIAAAGHFAVNILDDASETIARRFSEDARHGRFEGIGWHEATTGAPVLDDALAWVDCRLHSTVPAGDHTIFIGEVVNADAREGNPLLFHRGGYRP